MSVKSQRYLAGLAWLYKNGPVPAQEAQKRLGSARLASYRVRGLVGVDKRDGRRVYAITAAGVKWLERMLGREWEGR